MKPSQTTRRVFVSHSRHDVELGRDLARRLRAAGLEPRLDPVDLEVSSSSERRKTLRKEIRSADAVLFLITPSALRSDWLMTELGMSEAFDRLIIPVTAGMESQSWPGPLQTYDGIPFDEADRAIATLAEQLLPTAKA